MLHVERYVSFSALAGQGLGEGVPLPWLVGIAVLAGGDGPLRSTETPQIRAVNDVEAVAAWLSEYALEPNTLAAYRREAQRLLLWASYARRKSLSWLLREDYLAYEMFLRDPQPRALWCGPRKPQTSADWRPLAGPLGPSSIRQSFIILNTMLSYLVSACYLSANPFALDRSRRRRHRQAAASLESVSVDRALPKGLYQALQRAVLGLPRRSQKDCRAAARLRWVLSLGFALGPRSSEMVNAQMGDVRLVCDDEGVGRWWWFLIGKGGKRARLPMPEDLINELRRYRQVMGLPQNPTPNESTPLICRLGTRAGYRAITRNQLYRIVKGLVLVAADSLRAHGRGQEAEHIARASTHWLRHAAASDAVKSMDLLTVNRLLRHSRLDTTSGYLHEEDDVFYQAVAARKVDWPDW